ADNDPLTYSVTCSQLDSGISISSSGIVSWTPGGAGTFTITVTVSDGRGGTATQAYSLVVSSGVVNHPPYIWSTPITHAIVGTQWAYGVGASDPDAGQTLTYSFTSDVPTGFSSQPSMNANGYMTWSSPQLNNGISPSL